MRAQGVNKVVHSTSDLRVTLVIGRSLPGTRCVIYGYTLNFRVSAGRRSLIQSGNPVPPGLSTYHILRELYEGLNSRFH